MVSKTIVPSKLNGILTVNAKTMTKATAIEITPAGNGKYAVTIRTVITDQPPELFTEDFKGKVHISYRHAQLTDMRFEGHFLDFGVQDEKGECILSLYFSVAQEESKLVEPAKPSIQLIKG